MGQGLRFHLRGNVKRIVLDLDEKVFASFRRRCMVRALSGQDDVLVEAWMKILKAVESGDETVELKFRKEND